LPLSVFALCAPPRLPAASSPLGLQRPALRCQPSAEQGDDENQAYRLPEPGVSACAALVGVVGGGARPRGAPAGGGAAAAAWGSSTGLSALGRPRPAGDSAAS